MLHSLYVVRISKLVAEMWASSWCCVVLAFATISSAEDTRPCQFFPCMRGTCKDDGPGTQYTCICPRGFFGERCEIRDLCLSNPCRNGGTCTMIGDRMSCTCPVPISGYYCEISPCSRNPCRHGGTCIVTSDGFKCACRGRYTGTFCGLAPCYRDPCKNGGTCEVTPTGYYCSCRDGFGGDNCTLAITPCTSNPCKNGGICKVTGKDFQCSCKAPYSGETCETNQCASSPCRNGGVCEVNGSSFTCTCKEPFTGELCGEILTTSTEIEKTTVVTTPEPDACSKNPCKNEGVCKATDDGYKCYCSSPFTGPHCEKSPCSGSPCENNGICEVEGDNYICFCRWPYSGKSCEIGEILTTSTSPRTELEETTVVTSPKPACNCRNGKCITNDRGTTECVCNPGFGKHPKGHCEVCNCGEQFTCTFESTWFSIQKTCICPGNYKEVNGKCFDQCSLKPCKNGGTCKLTKDSYHCECRKEFTGKFCETEKCKCQNGKCIESDQGLKCVCNSDYGMLSPGVCKACNCGKNFTCTFKEDIFQFRLITYCMCPEGYSRQGPECIKNKIL